ncbi:MAG: ATP-binding cassette domain-containing protein, partial [Bacilli bacterium]
GYDNNKILHDLSIDFKPYQKNAIVGSTGSGKSTIISLIMKYYPVYHGAILIDNQDISKYNAKSLRDQISIVLQDTYLFEGTIYDNISLNNNYSYDDIMSLATEAHATFITEHPLGLNQLINETASNFSSGQKQIIALLRALIKKPKILIFDEASSNLDMESETSINNLINTYDITIIIIAHRIATIASCDHIFVIEQGKLVEEGTHEQLMANQKQYYRNIKSLK